MPMNAFSLEGKRILVTGASSGIGRATAIVASSLGAQVVLTARRQCELEQTRALCMGSGHLVLPGDVREASFLKALLEQGLSRKDAVKQTAAELGLPKNTVYALALEEE